MIGSNSLIRRFGNFEGIGNTRFCTTALIAIMCLWVSCSAKANSPNIDDCVDTPPLNDGWGWNGVTSCFLGEVDLPCVDSPPLDDGWGWNGVTSCQVSSGDSLPRVEVAAQEKIALPGDAQPAPPPLPGIGEFVDMPGTDGLIEMTRLTGPSSDRGVQTHSYSRRFAIDPFNKYFLFNGFIHRLADFARYKESPFSWEYVPALTKEDEFFGIEDGKLQKWNAATGEVTNIWVAPEGAYDITIGQWEGQQSWDDRYIAVVWNDNTKRIAVIDLITGSVTGQVRASSIEGTFNWADVSPRGTYVIVGTSAGVFRFDIDFTNKVRLNTNQAGNAHSDLMLDKAGNEVIVQEGNFRHGDISYTILESNTLHQMDLVDTTTQQPLTFPGTASHISGQATGVPGRVLVSLQPATGMSSMFAADLVPGQSVVYRWGHSYSTAHNYGSEAKATISNDGMAIVWTSNWMGRDGNYEFYARIKQRTQM